MNWRHRPPRSTAAVFRFLFAMSISIFRFLFAAVPSPRDLALPPIDGGNLSPHPHLSDCLVLVLGVILLIPEDRGAHRQESKAYPARSAALRLHPPPCDSWTSKARPAGKEATCRTSRSSIYPLPHTAPGFWQQSGLEPAHRPEGPGAAGPAELPAHSAGARHRCPGSRGRFLDLPG